MSSIRNYYHTFEHMDITDNLCHGHGDTVFPYAGQEHYRCNGGEVSFNCYSMFLREQGEKSSTQVLIPGFHTHFPTSYGIPKHMELDTSFHIHSFTSEAMITHHRGSSILPMFFDSQKRVYQEDEVFQRISDCECAIADKQTDMWRVDSIASQSAALLRPVMTDMLSRVTTTPIQCTMIVGRHCEYEPSIGVLQIQVGESYCDARISINNKGEAYMVAKYSHLCREPFDENGRWNAVSIIKCHVNDAEDVVRELMPFVLMVADDQKEES